METKRIPLYKVRSFGEKIGDTFAFVSENFKPLLKYVTYFMLPVALVAGLLMNYYMTGLGLIGQAVAVGGVGNLSPSVFLSMGGMMVVGVFAVIVLPAVIYGLMRVYGERENRLRDVTWAELSPIVTRLMRRSGLLVLAAFILGVVALALLGGLIALVSAISGDLLGVLGFTYLLSLVFMVVLLPLMLVVPVYLFEDDITLVAAIVKAFRLGFRTWGGIFAVLFVLTIVVGIVAGLVSLPWSIAMGVKVALGMNGDAEGFAGSVGFSFLVYLLSVVQMYIGYLCYTIPQIGMAYQYGHAAEKIDRVTVASDIDRFETLGTE